jgi:lysophospholipase L1-like esterase
MDTDNSIIDLSKGRRLLFRFVAVVASIVMTLAALECGLWIVRLLQKREPQPQLPALYIKCTDCPFLYRLNPAHPDISAQGLRDRVYAIPKPSGVLRILILGDSVTQGFKVDRDSTFAKRLKNRLDGKYGRIEVINAGVNGYTPYNELQYFRHEGRAFQADIVLVAFCMNDVVNPLLHWNWDVRARPGSFTSNLGLMNIPDAAIPNLAYHRNHALPRLASRISREQALWNYSLLYRFVRDRLARFQEKFEYPQDRRGWPVYITGEDTLSIEVLLDENSSEMLWLKSMYSQLDEAVRSEGAIFAVLVLPLAYQIEKAYPYMPQKLICRQCEANNILCLDVLPAFRQYSTDDLFLGKRSGFHDIWHLTEKGHQVVAKELESFLIEHGLLRLQ